MNFKNNVAIVTGSTSGIGKAIAISLADAGCKVMINSLNSVAEGEALAQQLPHAYYCQGDISDEAQCKKLIEQTVDQFGSVDFLINNAGISERVPHDNLDGASDELFNSMWQTNFMGTWYMSRAAMPYLQKSTHGKIINISSIAGARACGSSIPYAVSKAAVNHLTKLLANSCGPSVKVNAVAPGFVTTPRTESWDDSQQYFRDNTALGKAGTPEDIANVVLGVLASDFISGEIITVDGGFKLG